MGATEFIKNLPLKTKIRLVVGLAAVIALMVFYQQIDVVALRGMAMRLNGPVVFLLITILPLFGFPVSVLHVIAGVRFGVKLGMILVASSILLQLLASYAIVHLWRDAIGKRMEPVRRKIPRGAHGAVSLFTMLLPGVPYFAKNYVLPLIGVPLGTYLAWCFPLHALRSTVAVAFGDKSDELTPLRLLGFALYAVAIMVSSWWAFRRLRDQMQDPPPAANDLKPGA
jgi:uncharacterized membrane protein YdjX (TVP38/TMEM64 family)